MVSLYKRILVAGLLIMGVDQTQLRYVEPAKQQWDGTEAPEELVVTTYKGTTWINIMITREGILR